MPCGADTLTTGVSKAIIDEHDLANGQTSDLVRAGRSVGHNGCVTVAAVLQTTRRPPAAWASAARPNQPHFHTARASALAVGW
jgi:hypothetical protein